MAEAQPAQESRLSQIRHEINNVLAGIIGHTQLLRLRGELNSQALERLNKIEELAKRIGELAQEMKDS